nr:putative ribonuclease H-like domain-containing protein [Tanacetum cinerariifolium]
MQLMLVAYLLPHLFTRWIVLSTEDKLNYLEQPISPASVALAGQHVAPEIFAAHTAWIKGSKEIVGLMLMTMEPEIQRNLENLHAHKMLLELKTLFAQQAKQELLQTTRDFHSCKQEEGQPNYNMHSMGKIINEFHAMIKLHEQTLPKSKAHAFHTIRAGKVQKVNKHKIPQPQMAARGKNYGKGKNKLAYAPKPKIPPPPNKEDPAKDSIFHECGETGHWKRNCPQYLAELLKKKKNAPSGAGCSGIFVIELNNILNRSWIYETGCGTHICNTTQCLRASKKLKPGALSLYVGNGQREAVEAISVFLFMSPKNSMVYFSAIPRDGIFEIGLSNSYTNESSIYVVSNKRAKPYLDSALLWHCRLGHISKKCIEKLQHDVLLNSTDLRDFEKCVPCMSGKMARKPYTHQVERAKDLFRLIHTDVYGPFKIMSDKERTTLVFQKEVENQLCKTIKSLRSDREGEYMSQEFLDHPKDHGIISHHTLPYTPQHNASGSLEDLEIIQEEDTHPFIDTSLNHEEDDQEIDEPQSDIVPIRRSTRKRHAPDRMFLYINAEEHELGDLGEPVNYKAALLDTESEKWLNAMNVEMQSMKDNEVWVLVELPPNGKTVDSNGSNITFLILYVDDILIMGNNIPMLQDVKSYLGRCFAMKDLGEVAYILGIKNYRDRSRRLISLCQSAYTKKKLKAICMDNSKRGSIPMQEKLKLSKSQGDSTPAKLKRMQNVLYASTVGSIMYAVSCTRPDVAGDLKRELRVSCYIDAGYLTDSAKQSIFATSSIEAGYIAAFDASKEVVWVRKFISRLRVIPTIEEPISMYCDNTEAIAIANEPEITKGARHFHAKVHHLCEVIEYGDVKLEKVNTDDNLADPFTKALAFPKHLEHTRNIRMLPASSLIWIRNTRLEVCEPIEDTHDKTFREVIINGDSPVPTVVVKGAVQPATILTADQNLARRNELKACSTLLMALPDKHQLKFNSHKDAKTLMEAIEKRFRGNTETKKVQKILLKQQFENFTGSSFEDLDQIHDRLQKIVSQLKIHEVSLSQEDVNLKFLRSLPSEWKTHTLIWRNKANLDEHSLDDLFNSLRIYEAEVKHSSSPDNPSQNIAFVSSSNTDSTTDSVSAATSVFAVCAQLPVSTHLNINSLSNATERNLGDNRATTMGFDMSKVKCYNCHRKGHFARKCRSPKDNRRTVVEPQRRHVLVETSTSNALVSQCDGIRSYDWSYQAEDEPANFALIAIPSSSSASDNESDSESLSQSSLTDRSQPSGKYHVVLPSITGNFMPPKHDLVFHTAPIAVETTHSAFTVQLSPAKHAQDIPHANRPMAPIIEDWVSDSEEEGVDHLIKDCNFYAKPKPQSTPRNSAHRGYDKQYALSTKKYPQKHIVPAAVLTKSKPVSVTAARPGLKDKGVIDSGCSRHMTGNMSYLSDFQELNGGYVAFGGNPKGGKISEMCDKKNKVLFTDSECLVLSPNFKLPDESQVLLRVPRENNMYNVNLKDIVPSVDLTCLFAKAKIDESNLWHRRLGHVNFKTINKLVKGNFVRGLPTKVFKNQNTCDACKKGKQHRASCKTKPVSSITQPLFRLHIDLFGPTFVKSLSKKCYCIVITDDYSRFTWVFFLATKDETSSILKTFVTGLENQLSLKMKVIRSDNGTEFKNSDLNQFCEIKGIKREFSAPRTPQQNSIAERKNKTLIKAARTMLADSLLPILFWAEAVNTACYVQNRVLVTKPQNKTPYELLHGRTPSIGFMRPFGCPVTILNTLDSLGKFEGKVDEGFLVRYSVNSKAFRVFNSQTRTVQETLHVNFLENKPNVVGFGPTWLFDIDSLTRTMNYQPVIVGNQTNPSAGFQEKFNAGKTGEEADQQYMFFPVWSTGLTNPQNKEGDPTFDGTEHDAEKPESTVNLSPSSSALSGEQDDMTKKKDKGKSPIDYFTGNSDFNKDFEDYSEDSSNDVSAAGPIVPTAGQNYSNSTNPISTAGLIVPTVGQNYFNSTNLISATRPIVPTAGQNYSNSTKPISAAGPSNSNTSPKHGNSLFQNASQSPDMLESKYIVYSDHENVGAEADFNNLEASITVSPIPTTRIHNAHLISQIIGNLSSTTQTRSMARITRDQGGISQILNEDFHTCMFACFLSQEEPKRVHQALKDLSWIEAMQEELLQFKMQKVWILVDLPHGKRAIGTKWVYRNKKDERGIVFRNKARLVAQGHTQVEGIYYEEVFAPVARIEAIRLFLAYASFMGFMVYQMDVKSAFLYGTIEKEVYVCQPPEFEDLDHHDKFYKVVKALGQIDQTLFIKKQKGDILLVQIYVDDIIFGATNKDLCKSFEKLMKDKFQMSSMGELTFFLGKSASTPIDTEKALLKDPDGEDVDVHIYRSMIGSLMYLTSSRLDIMFAFWNTVAIKQSHDVTRLQALVDNKKAMVTEATIRDALHLDDAEGAISAKRTSWNEFSSAMASAVICLATGDLSTHSTKYISPALTQKVFANMRRVGKGCFRVETPLVEGMLVAREPKNQGDTEEQGDAEEQGATEEQGNDNTAAEEPVTAVDDIADQSIPSPTPLTPPPQQPQDIPSTSQADIYHIDMDHATKVLSMQEYEPEIQEAVEVVTTAKLITEVVAAVSQTVSAAAVVQTDVLAAPVNAAAAMTTAAPVKVVVPSTKRRRVVIRDPEEESSAKTPTETKSKDKGKGIMVEEPRPIKKKQQVKLDEVYARKLQDELNQ